MAVLAPSLEQMCLQNIAIVLCRNVQIKRNNFEIRSGLKLGLIRIETRHKKSGIGVERLWGRITSALPLSEELREKLNSTIVFIQSELDSWFDILYREFQLQNTLKYLYYPLFWTPAGTIDRQLSAENLIQNPDIEQIKRFTITCLFCLDNDDDMWENLEDAQKFKVIHDCSQPTMSSSYVRTAIFFRMLILRKAIQLKLSLKSVLRLSGVARSLEAVKYAWSGIEDSEEHYYLMNFFEYHIEINPYVCHFFLSMKGEKYLDELVRRFPSKILYCAIEWPLHPYFIQLSQLAIPHLCGPAFSNMLNFIIDYCDDHDIDYFICREFWKMGRLEQKLYFLKAFSPQFRYLLYNNEQQTVSLILRDAPLEEKIKIIFNRIRCLKVIEKDQREALEFMIKVCFPSKTLLSDFKHEFLKRFLRIKNTRVFPLFIKNCFISTLLDGLIKKCPENSENNTYTSDLLLFGRSCLYCKTINKLGLGI